MPRVSSVPTYLLRTFFLGLVLSCCNSATRADVIVDCQPPEIEHLVNISFTTGACRVDGAEGSYAFAEATVSGSVTPFGATAQVSMFSDARNMALDGAGPSARAEASIVLSIKTPGPVRPGLVDFYWYGNADEGFSDGYASLEILVDGLLDVRCSRGRCNAENLEVLDQPFTLGTEVAIAISGLTFVDSFYEGAGNSGLVYGYLGVQFREMPDPGDPATVPEPSTLALAIPLLGLISAARRRPRQRSA